MESDRPDKPPVVSEEDPEIVIVPGDGTKMVADDSAAERPVVPEEAAVLPIRNMVIFPGAVCPVNHRCLDQFTFIFHKT